MSAVPYLRLARAALVLLPMSLPANAQAGSPTDQAVTYQINPSHTGAIDTPGLQPPLRVRWSIELGATVSYPLIAEGKVFVTVGDPNVSDVRLYALSAKTGRTVWGPIVLPKGHGWWANAAYQDGKVFVVVDSAPDLFNQGRMVAYSAATGALLWSTPLPGQILFDSPPTALNGLVYTAGAGLGGTVYAVRQADGQVEWTADVLSGMSSSPAVTNEGVYVSYSCPQTYKFAPLSGTLLWHHGGPCAGGGGSTPVVYGSSVYVRRIFASAYDDHDGLVLQSDTGQPQGLFYPGSVGGATPAFDNGLGFFVQGGKITAQQASTLDPVWTAGDEAEPLITAPIVVNGVVYAGTEAGKLYGFDAATGSLRIVVHLGAPILPDAFTEYNHPTTGLGAGEGLLVVPASSRLVALEPGIGLAGLALADSSLIGSLSTNGVVSLNAPAPDGGMTVRLVSRNLSVSVPARVTIPAGSDSVAFEVRTKAVSRMKVVTIRASLGAQTIDATLRLVPIGVRSLVLTPPVVRGGRTVVGQVEIDAPAPGKGIVVELFSNNPSIARPTAPRIRIPTGETTGQFTVQTGHPLVRAEALITAMAHRLGKSVLLTVRP